MTGITEIAGRDVEFYMGDITSTSGQSGPPRICARTKTITVGGEPIDVTQDCDDGFRRLLGKPASRSIDMTVEGVIAQTDLIDLALDPDTTTFLDTYTLRIPRIGDVVCSFYLGNFELGAEHEDAVTFSATIQSSGKWHYEPEATT